MTQAGFFGRLGSFSVTHRWLVIATWCVLIVAALPLLARLDEELDVGGFSATHTEGAQARELLQQNLNLPPSTMIIVYTSESLAATDPAFLLQINASLVRVRGLPFVTEIITPELNPAQISTESNLAYVLVGLNADDQNAQKLVPTFESAVLHQPDIQSIVAGAPAFYRDFELASQRDLRRAELLAFPFALIALLVVFRTVVAAALPLVIGGAGVAVIMLCIFLVAQATSMSIFVLNLATMLGFGLAVDYSLFVTSRFREELPKANGNARTAITITNQTAGKSVVFSGATVLIGLSGLFFFPIMFLRSIGIAGVVVVVVSTSAAVTLLPAILSLVAPHIERWHVLPKSAGDSEDRFWKRVAGISMRRPWLVAATCMSILLLMGAPFLNANISSPDATLLPKDSPSRQGFDMISDAFSGGEISPFVLAFESETRIDDPEHLNSILQVIRELEADSRIVRIESPLTLPNGTSSLLNLTLRRSAENLGLDTRLTNFIGTNVAMVMAYPADPANSESNKQLLSDLRALEFSNGMELYITGGTAEIVDVVDVIYSSFPLAAAYVVIATWLVLLVLFRSLLLPLKAIVMNALSILASYGALVWIFQEGHLHRILNFTPQGYVEASLPVIMFCVLFGLSMDYEVFLLTRVREEWDRRHHNEVSVVTGLVRSGRIITSAALIVVVVTGSFAVADVVLVKALGIGIALAVALDATLIRMFLVPATMKLFGSWNWWLPNRLNGILSRWSINID